MSGTITDIFGEHEFTISDIDLTPASFGENPYINFKLQTPFGDELISEVILDGAVFGGDGCWVDRLSEIILEYDDLEALVYSVNKALKPFVAETKLNLNAIEASAKAAGLWLRYSDHSRDHGPWWLYTNKDNELVGGGVSLHAIQGELRRYRQAKRSIGRKECQVSTVIKGG